MANFVKKLSWLDMPDVYPRLRDMTPDEIEAVGRWAVWELSQTDPKKARALIAQIVADDALRCDHATWRSSSH